MATPIGRPVSPTYTPATPPAARVAPPASSSPALETSKPVQTQESFAAARQSVVGNSTETVNPSQGGAQVKQGIDQVEPGQLLEQGQGLMESPVVKAEFSDGATSLPKLPPPTPPSSLPPPPPPPPKVAASVSRGVQASGFLNEIRGFNKDSLKKVSQNQVLNLGEISSGTTTKESSNSRKLGSEVGGVSMETAWSLPGPEGSIDIVGHSSEGGTKIEGKSPQQLAQLLKEQYGLQKIKTINLVSCESEQFKTAFKQALADLGVEVGNVEGTKGRVAVDRATGTVLDEAVVGDLDKIGGHDGSLGMLDDVAKKHNVDFDTVRSIHFYLDNLSTEVSIEKFMNFNFMNHAIANIVDKHKADPNLDGIKNASLNILQNIQKDMTSFVEITDKNILKIIDLEAIRNLSKAGLDDSEISAFKSDITKKFNTVNLGEFISFLNTLREPVSGNRREQNIVYETLTVKHIKQSLYTGNLLHLSDPQKDLLTFALTGRQPTSRSFGASSLSTLDMDTRKNQITGRPAFSKKTHEFFGPMVNENHKRHITAWHSFRDIMNKIMINPPDNFVQQLDTALTIAPPKMREEAEGLVLKGQVRDLTSKDKVMMMLYIINSNPNNLWPGDGADNTAINRAFKMVKRELRGIQDGEQVGPEISTKQELISVRDKWLSAGDRTVESRSANLVANVINNELLELEMMEKIDQVAEPRTMFAIRASIPELAAASDKFIQELIAKPRFANDSEFVEHTKLLALKFVAQLEVDGIAHKTMRPTSDKNMNEKIFQLNNQKFIHAGEDIFEINELNKQASPQDMMQLLSTFLEYPKEFYPLPQD